MLWIKGKKELTEKELELLEEQRRNMKNLKIVDWCCEEIKDESSNTSSYLENISELKLFVIFEDGTKQIICDAITNGTYETTKKHYYYKMTPEQYFELLKVIKDSKNEKETCDKHISFFLIDVLLPEIALELGIDFFEFNEELEKLYKNNKNIGYEEIADYDNINRKIDMMEEINDYYFINTSETNNNQIENDEHKNLSIESFLDKYTTDLTELDFIGNPAIGREEEIKKTEVALFSDSAILVGEAGIGKTAIAEGIAYNIQKGNVPIYLKGKKILKITSTSLVSGCSLVGELEERMEKLLMEIQDRDDVILFFDEIHTAIGTGKGSNGTLDIANILKPYLDRGKVKIIGATTNEEYEENFKNDGAFRRRLEKVEVKEPDKESLYKIVDSSIENLEKITNIEFDYETLNKERVIQELIDITSLPKDFKNITYNPHLILSIIRKSFGYATYYGHSKVCYSDIEEAVNNCGSMYPAVRERFNMRKSLMIMNKKVETKKVKSKIISFDDIKRR